jgi:hypothetical protein
MNVRTILLGLVGVVTALLGAFIKISESKVIQAPKIDLGVLGLRLENNSIQDQQTDNLAVHRNLDQLVYDRSFHIRYTAPEYS